MRCGERARSFLKRQPCLETIESTQQAFEALEPFSQPLCFVTQQGFAQRRRVGEFKSSSFSEQGPVHRHRIASLGTAAGFERFGVITDEGDWPTPRDVGQVDASAVGQAAVAWRQHWAKGAVVDHAEPGDDLLSGHLRQLFDHPFE